MKDAEKGCAENFLVDWGGVYSVAAIAAASVLRSICGCVLPLVSTWMFANLSYGWSATLLALITVPVIPAPLVLFLKGRALRERFQFIA